VQWFGSRLPKVCASGEGTTSLRPRLEGVYCVCASASRFAVNCRVLSRQFVVHDGNRNPSSQTRVPEAIGLMKGQWKRRSRPARPGQFGSCTIDSRNHSPSQGWREKPSNCNEWRLWNFRLHRAPDVQPPTYQLPVCRLASIAHRSSKIFSIRPERVLCFRIVLSKDGTGTPAVPIKAMRCNARMALIV
jgi:hypothetical protein